jgi:predicted hydrolase (HD superfamily)
MIDRQQAFVLIKKYIKNENLIQKSLIAEAILRRIAKILGKNEELWGLTGLLYNIDYEYTQEEPEKRGIFAAQLLEGLLPENCINAIKSNNYQHLDYIPSSSIDKSLIATVAITDFIIAFIRSSSIKYISEININILKNKLEESNFTNINFKKRILLCNDIGIDLNNFLQIGINTLKEILEKT